MAEEYFWGLTLKSGDSNTGAWDPENEGVDGTKFDIQADQTLVIRQAVLGAEAAANEKNIVEVQAMGFNGSIKIPIVRLKVGEQTQCRLDLTFPDPPVTFTLVEGNGPVHLTGNIGVATGPLGDVEEEEDDVDDDLDEEEDENAEESEEDLQNDKGAEKKRKLSANANGKNKKVKLDDKGEDEDEESKKKKVVGIKKDKPKKQK